MPLDTYRKKRNFSSTPEPLGSETAAAPTGGLYVIQKHAARRLHYDVRLELDGVLKSWAVPKGPSLDPGEKRLAVHVEDHPIEYGDFEGVIPPRQYGAGTVQLWDRGTWTPEGDPREGYRKGRLKFRLQGEKLRGRWMLVRMHGQQAGEDKENWLLVKEDDAEARRGEEAEIGEWATASVASGRDMPEIAAARDRVWQSNRDRPDFRPADLPHARAAPLPAQLAPPLATLVSAAPTGEHWLHEIKYDGYRMLCRIDHGEVLFFSRNGNDWTGRFPSLVKAARELPVQTAWLDGEMVVLRSDGRASFQALQQALGAEEDEDILYFLFDLPYLDGHDLGKAPLERRKGLLQAVLARTGNRRLRYSDHVTGAGREFFEQACRFALEGVVSKRADSAYAPGRGRSWVKVKCIKRQEFVIGGYTAPKGGRSAFGALLLGLYEEDGALHYKGRVGTGFDERALRDLGARLEALRRDTPAFVDPPTGTEARGVQWVEPRLVGEVAFSEWTGEGVVRQASFQGLREDKPAREVAPESPGPPPREDAPAGPASRSRPVEVAGQRLTNPQRVLYPSVGLTKLELARYYERVASWLLPHLAGRPLTLVRCPEGSQGECFYQKHASDTVPGSLTRVPIPEDGKTELYLAADSLDAVIGLVQMGVLEIHTWGSRADRLDMPDRIIFDLDPDVDLPWERVVEGAQLIRLRLADLGLASFVKTTGGKGLHVVVPLARRHDWEAVKAFSKAFAEDMTRAVAGRFTAKLSKSRREGRIFIDYLRNAPGATAVAAYSTRARPQAPVSVPLAWEELTPQLRSDQFTVQNLDRRLANLREDPWRDYWQMAQRITAKMRQKVGL